MLASTSLHSSLEIYNSTVGPDTQLLKDIFRDSEPQRLGAAITKYDWQANVATSKHERITEGRIIPSRHLKRPPNVVTTESLPRRLVIASILDSQTPPKFFAGK